MKIAVSNISAIVQKELKHYFVSPIAYVVMMIFLTVAGWFFYVGMIRFTEIYKRLQVQAQMMRNPEMLQNINLNEAVIAPALGSMVTIFLFILPLVMMRIFAEEKRQKTDELLMTSPITMNQLIAGKFIGALSFIFVIVLPTIAYPLMLLKMSDGNVEMGPVWTGYLGILLFAASGVAIGMFASSLTDNQIIAAVVTFVIILFLIIVNMVGVGEESFFFAIVKYVSIQEHMRNLLVGLVDTRDLVYFLSIIVLFLFLTKRSVESLSWR